MNNNEMDNIESRIRIMADEIDIKVKSIFAELDKIEFRMKEQLEIYKHEFTE